MIYEGFLNGDTLLITAVRYSSFRSFELLIDNLNQQGYFGNTALHITVERLEFKMFEYLLKHGASLYVTNRINRTPVDYINNLDTKPRARFLRIIKKYYSYLLPGLINTRPRPNPDTLSVIGSYLFKP